MQLKNPPPLAVVMFCGLCLNFFIKCNLKCFTLSIFSGFKRALPDVFNPPS